MTTITKSQDDAVRELCSAVIEVCAAAGPLGAPGRLLYTALMTHGCTMGQFETIMRVLVSVGKLTKHGQCYRVPR
jgi:hypothetical protein